MKSKALLLCILCAGCGSASVTSAPATATARSGSVEPRLTWSDHDERWSSIVAWTATGRTIVSLGALDSITPGLLTQVDASPLLRDLTGDGVADLGVWFRSAHRLALWSSWEHTPDIAPQSCLLRCDEATTPQLCVCACEDQFADSTPAYAIAVVRDERLVQLVADPAYRVARDATLVDFTFDGHEDLALQIGNCTGGCPMSIWPFDTQSGLFVRNAVLSNLASVEIVDPALGLVESRDCHGLNCALFEASLIETHGTEARVIRTAVQELESPSSYLLRIMEPNANGTFTRVCESRIATGRASKPTADACRGWPATER